VDPRRLRIWEWITGLAGVVLLGSTFLDWYEADYREFIQEPGYSNVFTAQGTLNAWEAFSVFDVLIAIVALMAIATAVMAAVHNTPAVSLALASLLLLVGTIFTIALVVRVIALPEVAIAGVTAPDDDVTRSIGLWLGLAASVVVTGGALGCMRDERFPRAARVDVPIETLPPPEGGTA
jgi:hypothetical protein